MFSVLTIKEVQEKLGFWCKTLRKTEGLTQQQLAEELALSRITISNLERGENFTITTFLKVLQYFDKLKMFNEFVKKHSEIPESLY